MNDPKENIALTLTGILKLLEILTVTGWIEDIRGTLNIAPVQFIIFWPGKDLFISNFKILQACLSTLIFDGCRESESVHVKWAMEAKYRNEGHVFQKQIGTTVRFEIVKHWNMYDQ